MVNVNDFKNGMTIKLDGNIYLIMEFLHVKPGKGPAFVRSKLKNLRTGAIIEHTFNSGIKVERAKINREKMQFLYVNGDTYNFMNMNTYDQIDINKKQIEKEAIYLKEGLEVELTFYENELLAILLPDKIEYKIIETEPGVRGNTVSNATKDATLETGLIIRVPLFIETGENIIVSTKDGKYDSRA